MYWYRFLFENLACRCDPEQIHNLALLALRGAGRSSLYRWLSGRTCTISDPRLIVSQFGLTFPNPLGLAAGFDKDGVSAGGLSTLGFGFLEVGTVTPRPQPGNPRPRLFRLVEDDALINRLGFPSAGSRVVAHHLQLAGARCALPIGVSIGKNKDTPLADAAQDYLRCMDALFEVSNFFVLNVSSPNTPGLRQLQEKTRLQELIETVLQHNRQLAGQQQSKERPILLKIAPDLSDDQLEVVLDIVLAAPLSGIVVANTTERRDGLKSPAASETGGLSGRPLRQATTELVRRISVRTAGGVPLVGVGGIFSPRDALEKLAAGAALVQAYTGFVYQGPRFAKTINEGLLAFMDQEGIRSVRDLVGNPDVFERVRGIRPGHR